MIRPAENLTLPNDLAALSTGEDISLRGPRHKVYRLSDGRVAAVIGQDHCHKPDGSEVDLTPVRQGPRWVIEQAATRLEIPAGNGPPIIRMVYPNGDRVRVELTSVGGLPPLSSRPGVNPRNHLVWEAAPSTKIVLIPFGRRFKTLRILDNQLAPLDWEWEVLTDRPDVTPARFLGNLVGWDADRDKLQTAINVTEETTTRQRDGQTIPVKRLVVSESITGQASKIVNPNKRRRDWRPAKYPLRVDPTFTSSVNASGDDIQGQYFDFSAPIDNPPPFSANALTGTLLSWGRTQGTTFASRLVPAWAFDVTLPINAAITTAKLSGYAGAGATGVISARVRGDRQGQAVSPTWATGSGPLAQVGTSPSYDDTNFWPGGATDNWVRMGAGIMTSLVKAILPATPLTASVTTKMRIAAYPLNQIGGMHYAQDHATKPAPKLTIVYSVSGGAAAAPRLPLLGVGR